MLAPTPIAGVFVMLGAPASDARGSFLRLFDAALLHEAGINPAVAQVSLSSNPQRHTLRGMHFQADPHGETKTVRCLSGAVFDVALDLRAGSPTRGRWHAEVLRAGDGRALVIPPGCAHGFLSLEERSDVLYVIDVPYVPAAASGVRWNDAAFAIAWPAAPSVIGERDAAWADWTG
jgi:dTDP-4-dehydrorhamnose 3,5-epimerase